MDFLNQISQGIGEMIRNFEFLRIFFGSLTPQSEWDRSSGIWRIINHIIRENINKLEHRLSHGTKGTQVDGKKGERRPSPQDPGTPGQFYEQTLTGYPISEFVSVDSCATELCTASGCQDFLYDWCTPEFLKKYNAYVKDQKAGSRSSWLPNLHSIQCLPINLDLISFSIGGQAEGIFFPHPDGQSGHNRDGRRSGLLSLFHRLPI